MACLGCGCESCECGDPLFESPTLSQGERTMSWSYIKRNFPGEELYTVVVLSAGKVVASDSDWATQDDARRRVVILNGGNPDLLKIDSKSAPQALGPSRDGAEDDDPWLTMQQLADRLPAFSIWQIRVLLKHREQNGLNRCVHKAGRRLLIRFRGFNEWLDRQPDR
jgi:hypothetical protein